jgi:Uncharacterized protein with conserved CXXC pairs
MELVCIVCPNGCRMTAEIKDGKLILDGNRCARGEGFAKEELTDPKRSVSTTVATAFKEYPVVPVRTDGVIPKNKMFEVVELAKKIKIDKPLPRGTILAENLFGCGVNLILGADIKI